MNGKEILNHKLSQPSVIYIEQDCSIGIVICQL